MSFHNINLPKFIEVFAVGKPEFLTSYVSTISGREVRISEREYAKQKYLIKDCHLNETQFGHFNSFFRARRGRQHTFRFRDYADFKAVKQIIAQGDNQSREFYFFKIYEDIISSSRRRITKPVKESVKLYINDQLLENVSLDCDKGIIKLENPLMKEQILTADFIFDVAVRFNSDSYEYAYCNDGSIELSPIELVEAEE